MRQTRETSAHNDAATMHFEEDGGCKAGGVPRVFSIKRVAVSPITINTYCYYRDHTLYGEEEFWISGYSTVSTRCLYLLFFQLAISAGSDPSFLGPSRYWDRPVSVNPATKALLVLEASWQVQSASLSLFRLVFHHLIIPTVR